MTIDSRQSMPNMSNVGYKEQGAPRVNSSLGLKHPQINNGLPMQGAQTIVNQTFDHRVDRSKGIKASTLSSSKNSKVEGQRRKWTV